MIRPPPGSGGAVVGFGYARNARYTPGRRKAKLSDRPAGARSGTGQSKTSHNIGDATMPGWLTARGGAVGGGDVAAAAAAAAAGTLWTGRQAMHTSGSGGGEEQTFSGGGSGGSVAAGEPAQFGDGGAVGGASFDPATSELEAALLARDGTDVLLVGSNE